MIALVTALLLSQAEVDDEALQKQCGRYYMSLKVGMKWSIVKKCSGPFWVKYQDAQATVYEAEGGFVRVENGIVTRWIAKE